MKVAAKKTITYLMILVFAVTYISSTLCIDVHADDYTEEENPYTGNPENVFDLVKNAWSFIVTDFGILVDDTVNFRLHEYFNDSFENWEALQDWCEGKNMTTDDVVANYNISDNTVTFNIEFVKNIYNDVVEDIQEEEGWYWSSGKSGLSIFSNYSPEIFNTLKKEASASDSYVITKYIYNRSSYNLLDGYSIQFIDTPYFYINECGNTWYFNSNTNYYTTSNFLYIKTYDKNFNNSNNIKVFYNDTTKDILYYSNNEIFDVSYSSYYINKNPKSYYYPHYKRDEGDTYINRTKDIVTYFIYGPKRKIYTSYNSMAKGVNGCNVLLSSINDNLANITVKLDDLNRDWTAINTEIKNMIDEYIQDFQDYTDIQDKIDAAISATLTTMNENLEAGLDDIIGAIQESAAAQELWLERIYNKEVEILAKYLEENEQTQAVLVGIAEMLQEYFDASLANQGNLLTYEQFQEYAQQIIDAINNSSTGSGDSSGDVTIDLSIVDEFIQKIYEKETSLYEQIQEINNKLDTINDKITLYLYNTEKSIPFLKEISNLLEDGFKSVNDAISDIKVSITNNIVDITNRTATDDEDENASIFDLVNCVLYAVLILGGLVDLFLKLLEYVILMFQIPAQPWLFNSYILQGWEYAESIKIPDTDFGIIQFLRLLIYIILIFGVVKIVKRAIDSGTIDVIGK